MIQANELRIGNIIFDENNKISKIIVILTENIILENDDYSAKQIKFEQIQPIPLTEEILSKTNLTKPKGCEYYVLGSHSIDDRLPTYRLAYLDGKCHISVGTNQHGIMLIILDKLHELQNFHYAVIGEELQVNL